MFRRPEMNILDEEFGVAGKVAGKTPHDVRSKASS
jgi:hypothetical protein